MPCCWNRSKRRKGYTPHLRSRVSSVHPDHLRSFFDDLSSKVIDLQIYPPEDSAREQLKSTLLTIFTYYEHALHQLRQINVYSGMALSQISLYFKQGALEDQVSVENIRGKSLPGSYLWIALLCSKSLRTRIEMGVTEGQERSWDEMERSFEVEFLEVLSRCNALWDAIKHVVNAFIQCKEKTQIFLYGKVCSLNSVIAGRKARDEEQMREIKKRQAKIRKRRKQHMESLRTTNKGEKHVIDMRMDEETYFTNYEVMQSVDKDILVWEVMDRLQVSETQAMVVRILQMVWLSMDAVIGELRNVDKVLHVLIPYDSNYRDVSYFQMLDLLTKMFCRLGRSELILVPEVYEALVQCGKLIRDEIDVTEYLLMSLRQLILETRMIITTAYEYVRLNYIPDLPRNIEMRMGEREMCDRIGFLRRCCSKLRRSKNTGMKDEQMKSLVMGLMAKYAKVLNDFPIKVKHRKLKVVVASASAPNAHKHLPRKTKQPTKVLLSRQNSRMSVYPAPPIPHYGDKGSLKERK